VRPHPRSARSLAPHECFSGSAEGVRSNMKSSRGAPTLRLPRPHRQGFPLFGQPQTCRKNTCNCPVAQRGILLSCRRKIGRNEKARNRHGGNPSPFRAASGRRTPFPSGADFSRAARDLDRACHSALGRYCNGGRAHLAALVILLPSPLAASRRPSPAGLFFVPGGPIQLLQPAALSGVSEPSGKRRLKTLDIGAYR
jgi:hypothetical protein